MISKNPAQIASVVYNDVKDSFVVRLYRTRQSTYFEKKYSGFEIKMTCVPNYRNLIAKGMQNAVGERIVRFNIRSIMVESLLEFNQVRTESLKLSESGRKPKKLHRSKKSNR